MRTLTLSEFNELMNNWSKILIFCYWTNCSKCRMLEPELERIEWEMTVPLYKVNAEEDREMAEALLVASVPDLMLMQNWELLMEYNDVNTWDFILEYFWIWTSEHHDH